MSFHIPAVLTYKLEQYLKQLVSEVPGLTGALCSSVDGFVMAEHQVQQPDKMAAMTSSMMGLVMAMGKSLKSGTGQYAWVEFEEHKLLMMTLEGTPHPVYVLAIGRSDALMGTMLWRMRQVCQDIGSMLQHL